MAHIRQLTAQRFKRFTDLTVDLPYKARLVILCGPNGSGKSSLFDAIKTWGDHQSGRGVQGDPEYLGKGEGAPHPPPVAITFHEENSAPVDLRKRIYVRSAYRNDPDFSVSQISRAGDIYGGPQPPRMIDNDVKVTDNYQRLVALTFEDIYSGERDKENVKELREGYIGDLRDKVLAVFPDLALKGPGDPLGGGTFRFDKGSAREFAYKNLSGGEKAYFDLVLDLLIKRESYDDTVYCIDEPEAHSNPKVQGKILDGLLESIGDNSQLWLATHSIGMMRRARELQEADPESVAFLDFQSQSFDSTVTLSPVQVSRDFWNRTLEVALGDVANLVAPKQVVLCEGRPATDEPARAEFDARCFRTIFGNEMPDTDFLSVGNDSEVQTDKLQVGRSIQALVSGTTVIRVIDRDHRSDREVQDAASQGVRVLSRRHLETFLLDDEILQALCDHAGDPAKWSEISAAKAAAIKASQDQGKDPDDLKSAAGRIFVACRKILQLAHPGSTTDAFLADTLAPLVKPTTKVYQQLHSDIFGS
jgi:predicted ATPase